MFLTWIEHRMELLGIRNQPELAEISGISARTISRLYETGTITEANRSTRLWLARTLKVSVRELEALDHGKIAGIPDDRIVEWDHRAIGAESPDASRVSPVADMDGVPVIGRVAAGGMVESYSDHDGDTSKRLPLKFPGTSNVYALEIDGDSMTPEYRRGEFVILQDVDPATIRDGEDVMVQLNGDSEGKAAFKRAYLNGPNRLKLVSLNTEYPPCDVDRAHVIRVGRLVGKFTPPKLIGRIS